ncbi:MAG TPA: acetate kinase [Candidatus Binataceae bacterium]|nr:acetate kinase [Candidatus Binataceae bacterium]
MRILVFNCGSSSAKFELFELNPSNRQSEVLARGNFERIGEKQPTARLIRAGSETTTPVQARDHREAVLQAITWLERDSDSSLKIDAAAHRIVHGGPDLFGPALLDDAVEKALASATELAPLHNPAALMAIAAVEERLPRLPQVVLTDTAFHRDLPDYARNYALPKELARRHQIRRYGFHGIGHAWMMERYSEIRGAAVSSLNLITLHLGAGCSATAIRGGKSMDTSMGFTPLEGLMMATRSGDLDPAIVHFLCQREGIDPARVEDLLNHESGLLGVSGVSRDIRDISSAAEAGNPDAALALAMFCYRVRKYIGQYLTIAGKTRAIIFGGGIGEHAHAIRERICGGLEHLGIVLNTEKNRAADGHEARISSDSSPIELYVIPLNEELYIARAALSVLS